MIFLSDYANNIYNFNFKRIFFFFDKYLHTDKGMAFSFKNFYLQQNDIFSDNFHVDKTSIFSSSKLFSRDTFIHSSLALWFVERIYIIYLP